ncbi:putative pectate lyase 4 [Cardamine amara subsp. amara]|uniref:Pectate lyase 4 n=1 Tax=Cardamine amara subsp. amara TaxID=228776 RepID=A0ABD1C1B5_CARAN
MASLVLIVLFIFATFSSPFVEATNYSNYGYTMPASLSINPVDACWRRNPKWATNRQALAHSAVGFGKAAMGGKHGPIYVVTNPSDDPNKHIPGALRFGVIQTKPLWIRSAREMVIVLKDELYMKSHKKIDGRGAKWKLPTGHA